MNNDSQVIKKEKETTLITITPEKDSLRKLNRKVKRKYIHQLDTRKLWQQCVKILEVISERGEKKYRFREQEEAQEAEAEC